MDAFDKLAKLAGASVESVGEGLPRTWSEAKALGATRYFTGDACKWGHVAERFTACGTCHECHHQRSATPEVKERKRQQALAMTGDAVLFAINQAERSAASGLAPSDIITECPEPQRSQLQALVDRIKADPQAGKAVVGLLRTMRELRKVELAELAAA